MKRLNMACKLIVVLLISASFIVFLPFVEFVFIDSANALELSRATTFIVGLALVIIYVTIMYVILMAFVKLMGWEPK